MEFISDFFHLVHTVLKIMCVCAHTHGTVHMYSSEDNLQESGLSFHNVGSEMERRSSGLAAGTSTHGAISSAPHLMNILGIHAVPPLLV